MTDRAGQPAFMYTDSQPEQPDLPPPAPGMELIAKVYRGVSPHGERANEVTLAVVAANPSGTAEALIAAGAAMTQLEPEMPPAVAAALKSVTDWIIGVFGGRGGHVAEIREQPPQ